MSISFDPTVSLYLLHNKKLVSQGFTNRFVQKAAHERLSELENHSEAPFSVKRSQ
jgi:hypothetical protein